MAASLVLAGSSRVRYFTGAMMYFAQGIPQGLLSIAMPAWLASEGATPGEIGSYLAVVILPWVFKLVTGPFMDRYQFLPMGARRPWVLGAQLGLTLSLLALMLIENPIEQVGLLMVIGILVNTFAATQDVAVDGMAIDVTPIREQGRLNAFMAFGKAAGWSVTAAVSGVLLVTFGMKVTAIVASMAAGIVLIAFIFVLEREGERNLPWSDGEAASISQQPSSFGSVFSGINNVLWKRASIIIMLIMLLDGLVSGYGHALMPVAAVNLFGYTTPQWSQLVAMMGLIGAGIALVLGPMIDRFGAKQMLLLTIVLVCIHAFLIAQTQNLWQDSTYVRVMLSIWIMMLPVVMVCVLALAMTICSSSTSATQFAIYMSVANLGHSAGSKIYGMLADQASYVESYMMLGVLAAVLIFALFFHRHKDEPGSKPRHVTAQSFTAGAGGGGAVYFSGAMRCPKCRADMDLLNIEGTEVDRCSHCGGIWFDEGEMDALRNKQAAQVIDTGTAADGKQYNKMDSYPCPRCGGTMAKKVDPDQPHIWYETCADCQGSFFDAGEFRDLAEHTISDYFKKLITPKRQ
jgi:PAT family beta-lactamase induction signal transducer AmpG